ncbi:VIT1/CCC1 transporter family protein [Desulfovibrio sp. OttesenSCG-928-A18]|nr:VIT1/CCC1 transporter family protein [Desulfovibrio sp. OttesenSCG-928-A18]
MKAGLQAAVRRMYDNEATDALVYAALAKITKSENNRTILEKMAADECRHRDLWSTYVPGPPRVRRLKVWLYILLGRIFGLVFVLNLMESGEDTAVKSYTDIGKELPVALKIVEDEQKHEDYLISLIKEEKLSYISSMVLGLNDALVELTGALAGFTLALNDNSMIGLAGFITGVAATLSMAASEYLAKKADAGEKHPLKAATYTGLAYLFTVALLLLPYAIFSSPLTALAFCLVNATLIILGFTFFVSVIRRESFLRGFREMMLISFSVALISFMIGWAARLWLNLDL